MKINFVETEHSTHAQDKLATYYKEELIPAEKKPFLSLHRKSFGPYLAVEGENSCGYIQDAASQIATLGLGFNPTPFFGVPHFQESWTNNQDTEDAKDLIKAFKGFLKKKTANRDIDLCFVNSGAEANETAMGMAYQNRVNPNAKKVLAFEGSFHGRFMVSLFSTWNQTKREPFQLKGFETVFSPFPSLTHSNFMVEVKDSWRKIWEDPQSEDFSKDLKKFEGNDNELDKEIESLLFVKKQLEAKEIFVIITEPMQCEGGDRYCTNRFNTALLLLAKSYDIPLIFDEVQTGFGLGRDFFWHRTFDITDSSGNSVTPDYITCAKKSQTGLVIGDKQLPWHNQENQFASILRGFYHGLIIDQKNSVILELEEYVQAKLSKLVENYEQLSKPRAFGMAFAFEIDNAEDIPKFIANRFKAGLLFYQAGAQTLRFRLNTAYKTQDIDFLFDMIENLCDHIYLKKDLRSPAPIEKKDTEIDWEYDWHSKIIQTRSKKTTKEEVVDYAQNFFRTNFDFSLVVINKENYKTFRSDIIELEKEIYEPTRQTDIKEFDKLIDNQPNIALALLDKNSKMIGISFAGRMSLFPNERGLRRCRHFNDDKTLYMVDTTICSSEQGKGLGKYLKYTLEIIGIAQELNYIYGRNRDKLAGAMFGVNVSLGCVPEIYLEEDYPDDEEYRDVFIYRSPLKWKSIESKISGVLSSPLKDSEITPDFIEENIDKMINKICLSNFVSESFLKNIQTVAHSAPKPLRHVYTASGQAESVDKIAKSIYFNTEDKNRQRFISFRGHYFGDGSFLSRSLSQEENTYFPVTFLDHPTEKNYSDILQQLNQYLSAEDIIAIYIEPTPQKIDGHVPLEFLKELKVLAKKTNTKIVYNETSHAYLGHSEDNHWLSSNEDYTPDAFFSYLGGQAAMTFMKEDIFVEKPLMMISTWDGDALSLAQYVESTNLLQVKKNKRQTRKIDSIKTLSYKNKQIYSSNGPFFPTIGQLSD